MRTVTHRELRNSSGEILRAVAAGEDVLVTNNGEPAALITRPGLTPLELLKASGAVRPARAGAAELRRLRPRRATITTRELLEDLRGAS